MVGNESIKQKKQYLNLYATLSQTINILSEIAASLSQDKNRKFFSRQTNLEIEQIVNHLNDFAQDKYSVCRHILQLINDLPSETEKNILLLKYIHGYTWEEISEHLNYSLRQIYNIHNHALEHLTLE